MKKSDIFVSQCGQAPSLPEMDGVEEAKLCSSPVWGRRDFLRLAGTAGMALPLALAGPAGAAPAQEQKADGGIFWEEAGEDVMTSIFTRRSYREYTGAPLPDEALQKVLAAGMNAPSAHNSQPWRFVVLRKEKSLEHIPRINHYGEFARKAAVAVLVCTQLQKSEPKELLFLSTACCAQNMLLACQSLGYGGVWMQVYPKNEPMQAWRDAVGLPSDVVPICLVIMGERATFLPPVNRADASKVHYEVW